MHWSDRLNQASWESGCADTRLPASLSPFSLGCLEQYPFYCTSAIPRRTETSSPLVPTWFRLRLQTTDRGELSRALYESRFTTNPLSLSQHALKNILQCMSSSPFLPVPSLGCLYNVSKL